MLGVFSCVIWYLTGNYLSSIFQWIFLWIAVCFYTTIVVDSYHGLWRKYVKETLTAREAAIYSYVAGQGGIIQSAIILALNIVIPNLVVSYIAYSFSYVVNQIVSWYFVIPVHQSLITTFVLTYSAIDILMSSILIAHVRTVKALANKFIEESPEIELPEWLNHQMTLVRIIYTFKEE